MNKAWLVFALLLPVTSSDARTTTHGITIPLGHPRLWAPVGSAQLGQAQSWLSAHPFAPNSTIWLQQGFHYIASGNPSDCVNMIAHAMSTTITNTSPSNNGSNSTRAEGENLVLTYDWCYGQMTSDQRATLTGNLNTWFQGIQQQSWGGPTMPINNYFWGNLRNELEWAIASYYENTAAAEAFLDDALNTRWTGSFLPLEAASIAGGVAPEGTQYGRYLLAYGVVPFVTTKIEGRDIFGAGGFFKQAVYYLIYTTTPAVTHCRDGGAGTYYEVFPFSDDQFWYGCNSAQARLYGSNPGTYYGDFMQTAANYWPSIDAGKYAQQWVNMLGVANLNDYFVQAMSGGTGTKAFSNLPLDYYAKGMQMLWARKAWDTSSAVMHLQMGLPVGGGHFHFDFGNWQLWRGGYWLSRETTSYSEAFTGYNGTGTAGTSEMIMHNGVLINPDSQGCTPGVTCYGNGWSFESNAAPIVRRLESQPSYTYVDADLTLAARNNIVAAGKALRDNPAAGHVEREYIFVRSLETLVILDRLQSLTVGSASAESIKKTFLYHCEVSPILVDSTHSGCINGSQAAWVTTLVPSSPTRAVVNEAGTGDTHGQFRVEINDSGSAQSYFLHVVEAGASAGPTVTASVADSNPVDVTTGTFTLTLHPAAGSDTTIVFNKGLTSSGGTINVAGAGGNNLSPSVESISYTDAGPLWGGTASITGVTVSPASASITAGGTQQFTATCNYSDGTNSGCTSTVSWWSGDTAVATISSSGLASAAAAGITTVKAASGSVSGSAALTVNPRTPTAIMVSPATASIVAGSGAQQYAAACSYSDGTSADCSTTVTWSSSNTAVSEISSTGLASAVAAGITTIKAVSGSVSGNGVLTVTAPTLIVTTTGLAGAIAGTSYNVQLNASGGVAPYTWALMSGTLPGGLSLSTNGIVSGIPTTPVSATPLAFRVTDSASSTTLSFGLTLTVAGAPLSLGFGTCASTIAETQYVAFSGCTLAASGGAPPYTYSWKVVTDGSYASLPEGLSLDGSTGTISGTVYGQGRYVPQFAVTDSVGAGATLDTLFFSIAGDNRLGGCSLFPSDSIFHQRVDSLPVDTSPAAPIYSGYQSSALRVFFGNGGNGNIPNGIPFIRVPYNQANVSVTTTVYQSYFSSGPFPFYAPPEATSNNNGDRHVLVVQTAGGGNPCKLWEMWGGIYQAGGTWSDSSNAYWSNIGSIGTGAYAMLPQDNGSTDAAGLPVAPLLVTADEVIRTGTPIAPNGSVQHPVRFTVNHMLNRYVWPATAHAGTGSCSGGYSDGNGMLVQGAGAPTSCTMTGPAGEIYRLKAGVATPACAATSPQAAIIIQGFRNYGIILADNGMTGGLIGTPDSRWNDSDLACLTSLTLSDFEPVNVSGVASALTPNYNGSGYSVPVTSYQTTTGAPALTGIRVSPATASIVAGTGSQQYAAQCSYSDGTSAECTASVTWSSSNAAVATISSTGLASAMAVGTTTIKAVSGSVNGSAVLAVISATLTEIVVTPATASIVAGTGSQQYAAQCSYSNSTNAECTASVTWSSSNAAVATISSTGLASAMAVGTTTIKAVSGSINGSAVLTVTSAPLIGITVTPSTASIVAGTGSQQYAAQCRYSNSTHGDCTATVTWSSSNTAVATIGGTGLASAVAAGKATIKAVSGSVNGSGLLTVTPVPVDLTTGLWTWMGGSITAPGTSKGQPGTYATFGTPSAGNVPGSREASISWTDSNGSLWLFGGGGFDSAGVDGYLNDLWEFIPSIEQWAWMGGSSTVPAANKGRPGVYGVLGTAAAGNSPGGREASVGWTDKAGNLWLFGGIGFDSSGSDGSLNDLWEYLPSSHEWAWMGGSSTVPAPNNGQPGVYGQLGVPDAANIPGSRWGANSWPDVSGNLWLFGGVGYDSTGSLGSLNDLWELNPSTGKWAWMGGSSTVGRGGGQAGVYGSLANPAATNVPSGRSQAVSWIDRNGNFWLFGGKGYDSTGTLGYLNDLWEFNPSTRAWTWMGGSSTVGCTDCGMAGIYGTQGEADLANMPGGRNQAVGWTDGDGNFWLLGGNGFDSAGTNGILNDLWEYLPSTRQWAWMGGSNAVPGANAGQPGVYGNLGVPSTANTPGSRWRANSWTDGGGNLWLFGGAGYDSQGTYDDLNDLWVYQPTPGNLPAATPTLSVASGTFNTPQIVTISDVTPGATIYYTTNGATPNTSSSVYTGPITVSTSMTLEAIASANGYKASAAASATYAMTSSFSVAPQAGSVTNVTVQPGGVASYSLVVIPIGSTTFPAVITLTAGGMPPGSTVTFSPATVAAGVGATDVSLSIKTSATSASVVPARANWTMAFCLLFVPLIGMRRWRYWGERLSARTRIVGGILLLVGLTIAISGCSGTVINNNGSVIGAPTPYTITVTAASGNVHQTTTLTLTVQ
jgi:N-acetylneuraminic acid mutarotase